MGRELKRVPLDFQWPESTAWQGYINPHIAKCQKCEPCQGTGLSPVALKLRQQWYGYAPFKPEDRGSVPFEPTDPIIMAFANGNVSHAPSYYGSGPGAVQREAVRLAKLFNSMWRNHLNADDVAALVKHQRLAAHANGDMPTPQEVNQWSIRDIGHDAISEGVVIHAECERLGVPERCPECKGSGEKWDTPEDEQAAEAWTPTEPPTGPGYQIWETVSEGSPISPVFSTPEALARHMETTRWGGDTGTSYETWLKFITGPGWAPSLVMDDKGLRTGVQAS